MTINPSLRQLRAFVQVAREGNFSRAAEALHVSQSALSQTITQFEASLGGPLFDRTTRFLALSVLGRHLLERAEFILAEVDRTFEDLSELRDLSRGRVAVGCLASIAVRSMPSIIRRFGAELPGIDISLSDGNSAELRKRLLDGRSDFAISAEYGEHPDIAFQTLLKDPFCVLCRPDHHYARREGVSWAELAQERCIGFERETSNRGLIDRALVHAGVTFRARMELTQLGTVIGMVEVGEGVAAIPWMARPLAGDLVAVPLVDPVVRRDVGIARLRGRSLSHAAAAFAKMIEMEIGGF